MDIVEKFKETVVSVLPVMVIVLLLGFTVVPMGLVVILKFLLGGIFLILGLTIFLLGVDLGIQPIGERSGAELTKKRSLKLLLGAAFLIGFLVTIAEPDIQVFGDQVRGVFSYVSKRAFVFSIAGGVGIFIMLGLMRMVFQGPLKIVLLICYIVLFSAAFFAPQEFWGVSFDSGGATTGPLTVPFILALGLGVSSVKAGGKDDSFGLTGITSVGPVLAVIFFSIAITSGGTAGSQGSSSVMEAVASGYGGGIGTQVLAPFVNGIPEMAKEAFTSIIPLIVLFILFQLTLLKMTKRQVERIVIGLVYSFIGLTLFLTGVNEGFMPAGVSIGEFLGAKAGQSGGYFFLLILTGLVLGAIVVCAEPAVWVLTEQVEQVSGGTIKRRVLLVFLSVGAALAIALSLVRAVKMFELKWILIPGYFLALLLMIFSPSLFTGIAFDSGGVASGPITSTFVLSFTLGASRAAGGSTDAFGVIALVAMMPLIAIQLLGIIYNRRKPDEQ